LASHVGNFAVVGFDRLVALSATHFRPKKGVDSAAGLDFLLAAQRRNPPLHRSRGGNRNLTPKRRAPNVGLRGCSTLGSIVANSFNGKEERRHYSSVESDCYREYLSDAAVVFVDVCALNFRWLIRRQF
jgi:hypothetical protein